MSAIARIGLPQSIINSPEIVKPANTSTTAIVTATRGIIIDVTVAAGTNGATAKLLFYDGSTEFLIGVKVLSANTEYTFERTGFQIRSGEELRVNDSVGSELTFVANVATSSAL